MYFKIFISESWSKISGVARRRLFRHLSKNKMRRTAIRPGAMRRVKHLICASFPPTVLTVSGSRVRTTQSNLSRMHPAPRRLIVVRSKVIIPRRVEMSTPFLSPEQSGRERSQKGQNKGDENLCPHKFTLWRDDALVNIQWPCLSICQGHDPTVKNRSYRVGAGGVFRHGGFTHQSPPVCQQNMDIKL